MGYSEILNKLLRGYLVMASYTTARRIKSYLRLCISQRFTTSDTMFTVLISILHTISRTTDSETQEGNKMALDG